VVCVSHGFQTNYERGFCNALASHGVAVTLIASDRTDVAGMHRGVQLLNLRGSQDESRPRLAKLANLVRYHLALAAYVLWRRRSVVHVMGLLWPVFLCGVVEGLWFRLVASRYVLTVHDLLPAAENAERYRRLCRWSYRLADELVVHTARAKEALTREFGVPAWRITVMEHGIEPMPARAGAEAQLPAASTEQDRIPTILVFGNISRRKGTDVLLQALAGVSFPVRLVVAGQCVDTAFREQLAGLMAASPHRERVEWLDGFVEESHAETLLTSADLLALPYRHIDQSGVLFQAFRFGIPVLATRVGQFERYVTADVGELADAGDPQGLAVALERWHARRHQLRRERIREIGQSFEWNSTVAALAQPYGNRCNSVAARGAPDGGRCSPR
jgi:glycosyltransferase involved in cell wall biosynthesis